MPLTLVRPSVIVETAIQQSKDVRGLIDFVQLVQVPLDQLKDRLGDSLRIGCVDVLAYSREPSQKVATVDEDRHFRHPIPF